MADLTYTEMYDYEFSQWLKDRGWTGDSKQSKTGRYGTISYLIDGEVVANVVCDNEKSTRRIFINTFYQKKNRPNTLTLEQAKQLQYRDELWHKELKNADGTPKRFRVNGMVKTWKRDPNRIRVPLKHGLYDTGYLTNGTFEGGRFELDISEVCFPE